MEEKRTKPTNKQLQRRLEKSPLHLDFTKSTQSIFFSDKGVRLTIDDDYAIVAFGYSQTVYKNYTISGVSRPWLYVKRVIEIANENLKDIEVDGGYSFQKLLDVLKEKEDKTEYNIVTYFSWYLYNIFSPLYSIGESEIESFLVYEEYIHGIARQSVLLSEKNEDVTNKCFIEKVISNIKDFTDGIEERILFHKKTDEEVMKENIEAAASLEVENAMTQEIEK